MGFCSGDPVPQVQQKSQVEIDLQNEQLALLRQQRAETDAFRPYLLKNMGLVDEGGALRKMTEAEKLAEMTTAEKESYDILQESLSRQKLAAAGALPVSPSLEQSISDQFKEQDELLSRRLGSRYGLSTPGIKSMGDFNQKANLLRDESRHGELSAGTGLLLNQTGYLTGQQNLGNQNLLSYPGSANTLINAYGISQAPYQQQRAGILNAGIYGAQNDALNRQSLLNMYGTMAGGVAGGVAGYYANRPKTQYPQAQGGINSSYSPYVNYPYSATSSRPAATSAR